MLLSFGAKWPVLDDELPVEVDGALRLVGGGDNEHLVVIAGRMAASGVWAQIGDRGGIRLLLPAAVVRVNDAVSFCCARAAFAAGVVVAPDDAVAPPIAFALQFDFAVGGAAR